MHDPLYQMNLASRDIVSCRKANKCVTKKWQNFLRSLLPPICLFVCLFVCRHLFLRNVELFYAVLLSKEICSPWMAFVGWRDNLRSVT